MINSLFNDFKNNLIKKKQRLTKTMLPALIIALSLMAFSIIPASADGTVPWTGQGVTNGTLNTVDCTGSTAQPGSLLWIFTASGATSATITINGQTFAMTQPGGGSFRYVQTGFNGDFSSLTVSATYVGTVNGNPQLTVSHGCPALTARATLTKTFAQGPFTALPAAGDACFTLAPAAGTSTAQQCTNTPLWEGLPTGDYTVTETTTPAGYATMADITFRVRNDCTGVPTPCVTTGNATAFELGPVANQLLPGLLQVRKLLGPDNTLWENPTVNFYVCAHNPAGSDTELTPAQCNDATAGVVTLTVPPNPSTSGNLAEGYYTVCEDIPVGHTVDNECQVVSVEAGSTAAANQVTFVNTPLTARATLTKTFAQGPLTTLPASGDACFTLAPPAGTSTAQQCSNTPSWEGLPTGDYTITETTTPAGYATMDAITFRVRHDCTGVTAPCVTTGNATAFELGPVANQLLPGLLQVRKLLGPNNTLWTNPNVNFYVCAHSPAGGTTELTPTQCNATTAGVVTLTVPPNPSTSGNLAEGYYTVCENVPTGYTVANECQVVSVEAGSTAAANQVTFVNTQQQLFWCSPGFWSSALKQNRTGVLNFLTTNNINLSMTQYSTIGGAPLSNKATNQNPTLAQVLANPNTYGGPAFNSVANYISEELGWGGTQTTGENCPLNAHGVLNLTTFRLLSA